MTVLIKDCFCRFQVHAGSQQGPHHAGVPGADDSLPAAPLERLPQGHARETVLQTRGGGALLQPRPRRRHARADGAGLDGARARGGRRAGARAGARRAGVAHGAPGRKGVAFPQREEGHPHARARATQRRGK